MTHALVVLVALILSGCTASPPAKTSGSESPPAVPLAPPPAAPAPPPPGPSPTPPARVSAPVPPPAPAQAQTPAPAPRPAPAPAVAPAPKVLYVKTNLANFREGAGTGMRILRVLRQGARLAVLEERQGWFRVRLDDGQEGWVAASVTLATAP